MNREEFERVVERAVEELPADVRAQLGNVVFVVEDEPEDELLREMGMDPRIDTLFGLFDGVPLAEQDGGHLPGRIIVYYRPTVREFRTRWAIQREVRKTVIHEVGHLLGLEEDDIAAEGYE